MRARRALVIACLGILHALHAPHALHAQQPDTALANSQERLNEIRRERERLQNEMDRLRGRVHTLSTELTNIERQEAISRRILGELDLQVRAMGSQIDRTTVDLLVAEDALAEKRAILSHRLSEIARRGALYTFQVLLAAESFGDLISRYKYLYLASRQDRRLVSDVEALRNRVSEQRNGLLNLRSNLASRRDERAEETERLQTIERQREESLRQSQAQQRRTQQRLDELARAEARLVSLISGLERRRRAAIATNPSAPAATSRVRTTDIGRFDWPVEGDIVFNFGRAPGPGTTTIRWNGIGIGAPVGTPVRAIEGGTVRAVGQVGTYGLTVILDHGGGYYSVYSHLQGADVRQGQTIERRAQIGRTGGANSDEGPHLLFSIYTNETAVDPIQWLRRRR